METGQQLAECGFEPGPLNSKICKGLEGGGSQDVRPLLFMI